MHQLYYGLLVAHKQKEAVRAMTMKAEVNELQVQLDYLLAEAELRRIAGTAAHQPKTDSLMSRD